MRLTHSPQVQWSTAFLLHQIWYVNMIQSNLCIVYSGHPWDMHNQLADVEMLADYYSTIYKKMCEMWAEKGAYIIKSEY